MVSVTHLCDMLLESYVFLTALNFIHLAADSNRDVRLYLSKKSAIVFLRNTSILERSFAESS